MIDTLKKILNALRNVFRISPSDYPDQKKIIQDELTSLREKEIRIQKLFSKLKEYRAFINNLKQENDLKSIEIDKQFILLENDRNKMQSFNDDLQKKISELEEDNSNLKEQVKESKLILEQLGIDNSIKDSKIDRLEKEIDVLKNTIRTLVGEKNKYAKKIIELDQESSNDDYNAFVSENFTKIDAFRNQSENIDHDSPTESSLSDVKIIEKDLGIDQIDEKKEEKVDHDPNPTTKLNGNHLSTKERQSAIIPPEKRVGAQRIDEYSKEEFLNKNRKTDYQNRPRIICFKDGLTWNLGLEFPEDENTGEIEVFQEDYGLLWHCGVAAYNLWDGNCVRSLDPYFAVRDAYNQHREDLVKK